MRMLQAVGSPHNGDSDRSPLPVDRPFHHAEKTSRAVFSFHLISASFITLKLDS